MLSSEFHDVYSGEHRIFRNILLELAGALGSGSMVRIDELLQRAICWAGPRLRYHEEALYPALQDLLGHAAVRSLIEDHDRMIDILGTIRELVKVTPLTATDRVQAATLVKSLLPGLTRSFGLCILFDLLPGEVVQSIFDARSRFLQKGLDLMEWKRKYRRGIHEGNGAESSRPGAGRAAGVA